MIFPLITSAYVSRILLEDGIGKVAIAQNIVSYFLIIAMLGFPAYGVREIAKVRDDYKKKCTTFTELIIINTVATLLAVILFSGMVISWDSFRSEMPLYLSCGLTLFFNFINIDWLYQGQEEYVYITIRSILVKCFSFLAVIIFVHNKSDYIIYALISSLAIGSNYLFNIFHVRKFVSLNFRDIRLKKHMKPIITIAIAAFLGNIYNKVDITMLGFLSTDAVTGYYANAHKVILMIVTACQSISAVFMPRLSYYYVNDSQRFYKLIETGCKILCFLTVPATMALLILAPDLMIVLFGNSFAPAGLTLRIFAILAIIRPFGDLLCYQLLLCIGKEKERIPAYISAAVLNIILNAILIPYWNQNGAAVASVVSEFLVNGMQLLALKKYVSISIEAKTIKQAVVATLSMTIALVLIQRFASSEVICILFSTVIGLLVYGGVNCAMKNDLICEGLTLIKRKIQKFNTR